MTTQATLTRDPDLTCYEWLATHNPPVAKTMLDLGLMNMASWVIAWNRAHPAENDAPTNLAANEQTAE